MRKVAALVLLAFLYAAVWGIGTRLSSDAIAMGVGFLFGVMSGIPVSLAIAHGRTQQAGPRMTVNAPLHIHVSGIPRSALNGPMGQCDLEDTQCTSKLLESRSGAKSWTR